MDGKMLRFRWRTDVFSQKRKSGYRDQMSWCFPIQCAMHTCSVAITVAIQYMAMNQETVKTGLLTDYWLTEQGLYHSKYHNHCTYLNLIL